VVKPIVDGLESDWRGRARVLRLNILDPVGMSAARRFGVRAVPMFLVFDGEGRVVATHVGFPNRERIGTQVNVLLSK